MSFSAETIRQITSQLGIPVDSDAQTILAALDTRLEELAIPGPVAAPSAPPTPAPPPASPPGPFDVQRDPVAWAVATGRLSPARAQFWESQLVEERARTGSTAQIEATIASLSPVYDTAATRRPAATESETPLLDEFDRAMNGPSVEERRRAEDLAAERGLAEQIEREREQAAGGDEAARELFGD